MSQGENASRAEIDPTLSMNRRYAPCNLLLHMQQKVAQARVAVTIRDFQIGKATHELCKTPPGIGPEQPSAALALEGGLSKVAEDRRSSRCCRDETTALRVMFPMRDSRDRGDYPEMTVLFLSCCRHKKPISV